MCGSAMKCKSIRHKIGSLSLEDHEAQLKKCYSCLHAYAPKVNRSVASKTDKIVRLSFVEKHYQAISDDLKALV